MQQLFVLLLATLSALLSSHISTQTAIIQEQIKQSDAKLMQSHACFKEEVHNELDEFCLLMARHQQLLESKVADVSQPVNPSTPQVISSSSTTQAL